MPKKVFLVGGAIVVTGALVGIVAWEVVRYSIQDLPPKSVAESPTTTLVSKSNFSQIDTSTWKTYRNEKLGIKFRYPGDFFEENPEPFDDTIVGLDWVWSNENINVFGQTSFAGANFKVKDISKNMSVSTTCYYSIDGTETAHGTIINTNGVVFRFESWLTGGAGSNELLYSYRTIHKGICYEILYYVGVVKESFDPYRPHFDQQAIDRIFNTMVSTFVFTN